jgi:hypothetical protein
MLDLLASIDRRTKYLNTALPRSAEYEGPIDFNKAVVCLIRLAKEREGVELSQDDAETLTRASWIRGGLESELPSREIPTPK